MPDRPSRRLCAAALLALVTTVAPSPGLAQDLQLSTRYSVSLLGLPVGQANFTTRIEGGAYEVSGDLSSAGLADLVTQVSGRTAASGGLAGGEAPSAERFSLNYTADGESWSSDLGLRAGTVTSASVAPNREDDPPADYVAVRPQDLSNVADPLSAMMIRAEPGAVCARTLSIYDGWTRLNIRLSDAGTRNFSAGDYSAEARVCEARLEPVSGYRENSRSLRWLRDQTLQFWFAPIGEADLFAPVYVRIPTQVGPLSLTATRLSGA